jgi:hypothetical protein
LGVFSDAFQGHKMRVHLLTAPSILVIWPVTHPSTNGAQQCLTLVIKWVPVCPTGQDADLDNDYLPNDKSTWQNASKSYMPENGVLSR